MAIQFDVHAANAIFTLPRIDGQFDTDLTAYLRGLSCKRPSVLLAFAPKAAGTFLRSAAIHAVDGQLVRLTHAQGGRDGTPYLPTYIMYLAGGVPDATLVGHIHMQAFPANRHFIEALELRPTIMLRDVADMLVSYVDMLEAETLSADHWLNVALPNGFAQMGDESKMDFVIAAVAPWYASYFATWRDYVQNTEGRVCVLNYADFKRDPVGVLETMLRHSGLERTHSACAEAIDIAWLERAQHRFNKGEVGRGRFRLTKQQRADLARLLFEYYDLEAWRSHLLADAT